MIGVQSCTHEVDNLTDKTAYVSADGKWEYETSPAAILKAVQS